MRHVIFMAIKCCVWWEQQMLGSFLGYQMLRVWWEQHIMLETYQTGHCPVVTSEPGCSHSSRSDQSVLVVHQCLMVDKSGCSHSSWSDQSILVIHQCLMVDKSGCSHSDWSNQSLSYISAWWLTSLVAPTVIGLFSPCHTPVPDGWLQPWECPFLSLVSLSLYEWRPGVHEKMEM